jgi:sugar phosphate isomerase/epimerase
MSHENSLSRRGFLAVSGAGAAALSGAVLGSSAHIPSAFAAGPSRAPRTAPKKVPIGIELYAVRKELARDLPATLRAVREMGYEVVEFYAPYLSWTMPYAKDVRTQLDDLGLRCYSTHNSSGAVMPGEGLGKTIELNQILGARHIVVASPPNAKTTEEWKRVAGQFAAASEQLKPHGLAAGFHNHLIEWTPIPGGTQRPMDIIAAETPAEFVLQLDVGTALEGGVDPVAWIKSHPGRIKSLHLKDWAPGKEADGKGFQVLFAEGIGPWKQIFDAAESVGGVEFYLMEQEGSRFSELETARRCLETWRNMRKST